MSLSNVTISTSQIQFLFFSCFFVFVSKAGQPFCKPEVSDEVSWPKTPPGVTLVNNTCPVGRVGQKQRTCGNSSVWLDVLSNCVSEELKKVSTAADVSLHVFAMLHGEI